MISTSTMSLRHRRQSLSISRSFFLPTNIFKYNLDFKFHRRQQMQVLRTSNTSTSRFGWRESEVGRLILFDCRILTIHYPTERRLREVVKFIPSNYTGSRASLDLSMRWVKDCAQSHILCNLTRQSKGLPTRLINTGLSASSLVRLCYTSELPMLTKYLTPSHC
jgi:hypothetical protein